MKRTKTEATRMIRDTLEVAKLEIGNDLNKDYSRGFIKGLDTALFFLGEKQARRDHEIEMVRIYEDSRSEASNVEGER